MKKNFIFIGVLITGFLFSISCREEKACVGCVDGNQRPIAIAGPDQLITLPTGSISMDGSVSNDPDGTISDPIAIGWLWTRVYAGIHTPVCEVGQYPGTSIETASIISVYNYT